MNKRKNRRNHGIYTWTALLALILAISPAMAQVKDLPTDMPKLDQTVIQGYMIWGAAGLFSLLILIIALKTPKRTFFAPK